jgi:hypothetical protein
LHGPISSGVTRINLVWQKALEPRRVVVYLESLLCNAPTEAFSNKRSRARRRMYVRWCIPRGLFGKGWCPQTNTPSQSMGRRPIAYTSLIEIFVRGKRANKRARVE